MTSAIRKNEATLVLDGPPTSDAPNALDTFMWQADPRTLRFVFTSGQVGRILGAVAQRLIEDRRPWHTIAGPDRHRVELALRSAVREGRDGQIDFVALDAGGRSFEARLAIRINAPQGGAVRLWGLFTDLSGGGQRLDRQPPARSALPLVAPPALRRAGRFAFLGLATVFASYALAVSTLRPLPSSPPTAVAIQRADHLENVLNDYAADETVLTEALGSIEASVVELAALEPGTLGTLPALEELRIKIAKLLALTPPELAGRLRALLAKIDRIAATPSTRPVPVSKPDPPAGGAPPASSHAPQQPSAPSGAPAEAPGPPSGVPGTGPGI